MTASPSESCVAAALFALTADSVFAPAASEYVTVGSVAHPMGEDHHIGWVALETAMGNQRKELIIDGAPEVSFALVEGDKPVAAYAYCNLHGLWKAEI